MTDPNRALLSHFFGCLNRHDLESAAAVLAPECQILGLACRPLQVDEWLQALDALFDSVPEARYTINDTVAEGDRLAVRHTFAGTHLARLGSVPPSGRRVQVEGAIVLRVHDGHIVEAWLSADFFGVLQQIGAISIPEF